VDDEEDINGRLILHSLHSFRRTEHRAATAQDAKINRFMLGSYLI